MAERQDWIEAYEQTGNAAEVCRRFRISAATLRKWWRRYQTEGAAGLAERSTTPAHSPAQKIFAPDRAAILALRRQGLGFGQIRAALAETQGIAISVSSIRRILARAEDAPAPAPRGSAPPRQGLAGTPPPEGVAALLAEAINGGQFAPGEKLAEEALARRFGVGRTKVREALRRLSHLGVVRIERNRGAFVAMPSHEDIARAYEARRVVEGGIIADLGRLSAAQIDTLRRHVAQQAAAEASGHRVRLVQLLTEFHHVLAAMSFNLFLRDFLEKLTATTSLAVLIYDRAPASSCAVQDHRDLVEFLAQGDTAAAAALMLRHLGTNQARVETGEAADRPASPSLHNAARRADAPFHRDHRNTGLQKAMMTPAESAALLGRIGAMLEGRADGRYGLHDVTQKQHALQTAWQAERDGGDAALIAAALLHDIGHLVHDLGDNPAAEGVDDRHEEQGYAWLAQSFGPEVTEPVRLHVAAKRFLCATEPDYFSRLSPDSVLSLSLQGGPMSTEEVAAFRALPQAEAAIRLRRYDDQAKIAGLQTPPVAHFLPYVAACLGDAAQGQR